MMRSCLLFCAAALMLGGSCSEPSAVREPAMGGSPTFAQRVDEIVERALADGFGGGVAVLRGDTVLYHRVAGYADGTRTTPVHEATLYHVASITKYLTACLVLVAVEEAVLSLDQPIDRWVPGSGMSDRGYTPRELLAHQSGLGTSYAAETHSEAAEALVALSEAPWDGSRRGSFRYSNDGYDLLAIVLERAYRRRYEELVREKLMEPAGITHFGFWGESELADPRRVGQPLEPLGDDFRRRSYGMLGSAGWLTTALDLARFERALERGRLLSADSIRELRAPRGVVSIGQATLGGFLGERPQLGGVLSARGFEDWGDNAILERYLEYDVIVAVVTSRGPAEGEGEPFRSRISTAIAGELVQELKGAE